MTFCVSAGYALVAGFPAYTSKAPGPSSADLASLAGATWIFLILVIGTIVLRGFVECAGYAGIRRTRLNPKLLREFLEPAAGKTHIATSYTLPSDGNLKKLSLAGMLSFLRVGAIYSSFIFVMAVSLSVLVVLNATTEMHSSIGILPRGTVLVELICDCILLMGLSVMNLFYTWAFQTAIKHRIPPEERAHKLLELSNLLSVDLKKYMSSSGPVTKPREEDLVKAYLTTFWGSVYLYFDEPYVLRVIGGFAGLFVVKLDGWRPLHSRLVSGRVESR